VASPGSRKGRGVADDQPMPGGGDIEVKVRDRGSRKVKTEIQYPIYKVKHVKHKSKTLAVTPDLLLKYLDKTLQHTYETAETLKTCRRYSKKHLKNTSYM
jgi:hypothetical protein